MRLNALGILCADIHASLEFYRSLGVPFGDFDPAEGHYSADVGGGIRLMLDTHEIAASFIEGFTPPQGNDVMTLAVEFDTPREVDAAYASITAAGHPPVRAPFDAFWGQRYATVADPDGNHVDLYATSPSS